ncbi:hypothetical protein, partial [[Pseudomonas] boreopolis]|uniref:hypothetical protein n=1 Tax=Xanthomonas boreopolis TaxID=86183 RepID=UPI003D9B1223
SRAGSKVRCASTARRESLCDVPCRRFCHHRSGVQGGFVSRSYSAVTRAAAGAGVPAQRVNEQIREMSASAQPGDSLVKTILARHLSH